MVGFIKKHTQAIYLGIGSVSLFAAGLAAGWYLCNIHRPEFENVRELTTEYQFIEPLLFLKNSEDTSAEYRSLKQAIESFSNQAVREGRTTNVSISFRNLNTSQWVATNIDERYTPASMFKVLTLIGVLRKAEENPKLLSTKIKIEADDGEISYDQVVYPPEDPLEVGETYTVNKLIEHLIINSDNIANHILSSMVGEEQILNIYDDLQLPHPNPNTVQGYTVQEYSRLYRTLYNATYLSRSVSEQILHLLSQTNFRKGLVAGVPEGTIVSHKFGVNVAGEEPNTVRELHDCGIIYYPELPYILCVMTRGDDFSKLEEVIKDTSALVWGEVENITTN